MKPDMLKTYRYYGPHPFRDLHQFIMEAMVLICQAPEGEDFESAVLKSSGGILELIRQEA